MRRRQPRSRGGAKGGEPGVTFVHVDYNCDLCRFSAHPPPPLYSSVSSSSSPFLLPLLTPLLERRGRRRPSIEHALLVAVCIVRNSRETNRLNTMKLKRSFRTGGCSTLASFFYLKLMLRSFLFTICNIRRAWRTVNVQMKALIV